MVWKGPLTRFLAVSVIIACALLICLSGCAGQQTVAKSGDTVRVQYSVSFTDGTEFESNRNTTPLEFTVGSGIMIPGFDEAVVGMSPGQTKTITIPSEKAYGSYKPELVNQMNTIDAISKLEELKESGNFQPVIYPGIGLVVNWVQPDGVQGHLRFYNETDETVTVDENHPLAGKDLVFEITLVEIVSSPS